MDVPVRFIDSIINNPLLMQFLVHRWFFLLEYDPRLDHIFSGVFATPSMIPST